MGLKRAIPTELWQSGTMFAEQYCRIRTNAARYRLAWTVHESPLMTQGLCS